jgi:uncharacterized protein YndB with AHSA1/START domain
MSKLEVIADPSQPIIRTRRTVAAPRALVFDAFTKPELVQRWMGPRAVTFVRCESDLRPGGAWRHVFRAPDGQEFFFNGVYREIKAPESIVRTFVFQGDLASEAVETFVLEERDGRTTISTVTVHKSMANRDMHLKHGMERGMTEGYERLDELLAALPRS